MKITSVNQQSKTYYPNFQANPLKKTKYAIEYIDCAIQKNYPNPEIFRQFIPSKIVEKKVSFPVITLESASPIEDLKEVYNLYKEDFSIYHNYLSYKKFKNNLALEKATVFLLKSDKETVGFYSVSRTNKDILYICDIDMNPKYRNTRQGKNIIMNCWDNINRIAEINQCSKIGLHVSTAKKNLISLYKKLGFNVVSDKSTKYSTGQKAYYMEKEVGKC